MLLAILQESLLGSLRTLLLLLVILIPIMIVFEYARHYHYMEKLSRYFRWLTRCLTLSPEAVFPLMIGLFFGLLFGAAIIIEYARQELISKRDLALLGIFLAMNHSIIEDNLIFTALGANLMILLVSRFILAVLATRVFAYLMDRKEKTLAPGVSEQLK